MRSGRLKFVAIVGWLVLIAVLQLLWSQNYNNSAKELALVTKAPELLKQKSVEKIENKVSAINSTEEEIKRLRDELRKKFAKEIHACPKIPLSELMNIPKEKRIGCTPAYPPKGQFRPYYNYLLKHGLKLDLPRIAISIKSDDGIQFVLSGNDKPKVVAMCLRYSKCEDQQVGYEFAKKTWISDKANRYRLISAPGFLIVTRNANDSFVKTLADALVKVYHTPKPTIEENQQSPPPRPGKIFKIFFKKFVSRN